jgi:hypothetical protein
VIRHQFINNATSFGILDEKTSEEGGVNISPDEISYDEMSLSQVNRSVVPC